MVKKARLVDLSNGTVNCACVIHGDMYSWRYVTTLYNMLLRNISAPIKLHVFTEATRSVPAPFIKHALRDWPSIHGPKRAWWYKMQMFDPSNFQGRLLYFDLDVVICDKLDWLVGLNPLSFWTIRDFRHLWRPSHIGINSSVMYWSTTDFAYVWEEFNSRSLSELTKTHEGDQDFLTHTLHKQHVRFFDEIKVKSWRWQIKDGGMNYQRRSYISPNAGSVIPSGTAIMIFHGKPKPDQIRDNVIDRFWR